jgi:outer membrane protein assembly factor BamE (lipoprotein component of BamABCDE complex)
MGVLVVKKWILSLGLGLAVTGCVTEGKDFKSDVTWIKDGATKVDDVKMVLGEPHSVGNSGNKKTWTYGFYRYKLIGKSLQKELKFYWNPDGTVSSFSFNSSFPEDTGKAKPANAAPAADKPQY